MQSYVTVMMFNKAAAVEFKQRLARVVAEAKGVATPLRQFTPSVQQSAFFDWIDTARGSLVLEAVAGSGKTETLARGILHMADWRSNEFDRAVRVGTCHSVGLGAWRRFDTNYEIEEKKTAFVIERMCLDPNTPPDVVGMLTEGENFIRKLVSLGKQMLAGVKWSVDNLEAWLKLVDHYGVDVELPDDADVARMVQLTIDVFRKSGHLCKSTPNGKGMLDFDDMIWAPLAYNARFFQVDWVLIDEAQDTNPARRELAKRMMKPGGRSRLVAVGDSRQAIYGFTGADAEALDLIASEFTCSRLPLSVSYRCPRAVVAHAQTWVDHIEAHPDAPEGDVRSVARDAAEEGKKARPWYLSDLPSADHAILCRYNAPLVATAFALLKEGVACKMEGRDIGMGLIVLARRWKVKTLDALENRLEKYLDRELTKAKARRSESMAQSAKDRVDCLKVFIQRCRDKGNNTVECVVKEIEALFADNVEGILTLASGHKSKGREWSRVYWLADSGPKRELKPHEQKQEDNLKYVITTRAKQTLVLVPEGGK